MVCCKVGNWAIKRRMHSAASFCSSCSSGLTASDINVTLSNSDHCGFRNFILSNERFFVTCIASASTLW